MLAVELKGTVMSKAQAKKSSTDEMKDKKNKDKDRKNRDEKALIGQVKKVIKKTRRKLSEEKFEKQLQRTIAFLEELKSKLGESNLSSQNGNSRKKPGINKKTGIKKLPKKNKTAVPVVTATVKTNE